MWKEFIVNNWQNVASMIGIVVSFIVGRKTKRNIEKSGELDNIEKVREIEKALLQDMEDQIKKLIETNNKLEDLVSAQNERIREYEANCKGCLTNKKLEK